MGKTFEVWIIGISLACGVVMLIVAWVFWRSDGGGLSGLERLRPTLPGRQSDEAKRREAEDSL